jgi:hypothetical protein
MRYSPVSAARKLLSFPLLVQQQNGHERIADAVLREAIERAERGTIDADLGGGLIRQRLARPG